MGKILQTSFSLSHDVVLTQIATTYERLMNGVEREACGTNLFRSVYRSPTCSRIAVSPKFRDMRYGSTTIQIFGFRVYTRVF